MGLAASTVVGAMLVAPPKSEAIFHWFRNCFRPRTTVAMPVVGASACDPCATQQVVQYVPQVAYRTEIVNVPVTTYRPVTSCGPCGPVTTYRPVVTYRPTTRVVPYTTYRPVVTTTARRTLRLMPTVSLMPSTTTTLYAPATSSACCGGSTAAATSYATPSYASPSYATPSYSSGTTYQNGTTTSPSYSTTPAPSSGSTYATPAPSSSSSSGTQETPRPSLRPQTGTSNGYEGSGSRSSNQSLRPIPNQNAPAASQPATPAQQQQPQSPQQLNNGNGDNNQDRTGGAGPYFAPPASSRTTMQPEGWTRNYSPVNWTAARPVAVQQQAPAPRQTVTPLPATRPAIDDSGWQPVRPRP